MTSADETLLPALRGDAPLGFLAALGVQAALESFGEPHDLSWIDGAYPIPRLTPSIELSSVAAAGANAAKCALDSYIFKEGVSSNLKLDTDELETHLRSCRNDRNNEWNHLFYTWVQQGAVFSDSNKLTKTKPSNFYFWAANQDALKVMRNVLKKANPDILERDLVEWNYSDPAASHSLRWDVRAQREHAYRAADPSSDKSDQCTNHGAEAWALLGSVRYPCFGAARRGVTAGMSGDGKQARAFQYPLWRQPASTRVVSSLIGTPDRSTWMRSQIFATGKGFYAFAAATPLSSTEKLS